MAQTLITDRSAGSASYTILRSLGKGGMAEVFLSRQEGIAGFRRLAVIKKILPQLSQVPEIAQMLLDEARIAAQLNHPNIVQIYELGQQEGQYFISMEFVDGCDLASLARCERNRQGRVPLRLAIRIAAEAAMGLDYAHRQTGLDGRPLNIVHRDISPHNILCSREGIVKVTDFGIAKAVGKAQVTQVGVVKGKVHYMSPEQYMGGEVDHRSDIYALGVVLYQLTTGRLPRVSEEGEMVVRRVLEGKIPRPTEIRPDYPDELEEIVLRAMAHLPQNRYADAASFRDELYEFARENDLLAFPKELGDYVNSMVPPTAFIVQEQSVIEGRAPLENGELSAAEDQDPLLIRSADDDQNSGPRCQTTPASRRARHGGGRSQARRGASSDPFARTMVPTNDSVERAVLVDEQLTPVGTDWVVREGSQRQEMQPDRSSSGASLEDPTIEEGATPHGTEIVANKRRTSRAPPDEEGRTLHAPKAVAHTSQTDHALPVPTAARLRPAVKTTAEAAPDQRTAPAARKPRWMLLLLILLAGIALLILLSVILPHVLREDDPSPTAPALDPSGAGVINVLANPSHASVSVDGAQRCPSTPCQIGGLPLERELLITLKAREHSLWMQRIVLTRSEPKLLLRADLTPQLASPRAKPPAPTPIQKPAPTSAQAPSSTAPAVSTRAASKTKGRETRQKHNQRRAKKSNPKRAVLSKGQSTRRRGQMVTLDINSDQAILVIDVRPWAEVWVNGKKVGVTPFQRVVPPGTYKVELKNPQLNFQSSYQVTASKGKKIKILEPIPAPGSTPPEQ